MLTLAATASCQTNRDKVKPANAKSLRSFRQPYRDSLPQPIGYVNDYENLFTNGEEQILDSLLQDFEKRTTIQIALITIDTTLTTADGLDALILRIARFWGVGQKGKDNGVTVGISRGYRRMRIQNGYGIEKILSDADTKQLIETAFVPGFREAKYFEGTRNGLVTLMKILEERYK